MDRRMFLGAGMAGAATLTFSSVWSQSTPSFGAPTLPEPGFRKLKVGAMEVIALNDGALRRPLGEEFVRNAPLEQVKAMLASQNLPTDYVDIPFTPYLVVSGNTKFLIDTGFADNGPPTTHHRPPGRQSGRRRSQSGGHRPRHHQPLPRRPHQRPAQERRLADVPEGQGACASA